MIELTEEQRRALDLQTEQPPIIVDPRNRQEYLLIRREVYQKSARHSQTFRPRLG